MATRAELIRARSRLQRASELPEDHSEREAIVEHWHAQLGRRGLALLLAEILNEGERNPEEALLGLCVNPEDVFPESADLALDDPDNDIVDFGWGEAEGWNAAGDGTDRECVLVQRFHGGPRGRWETRVIFNIEPEEN